MSLRGTRALVTGGGGFIGSHLAERLVELGATTRAMVHYNALGGWGWLDHSPARGEIEVLAGDVTDRDSVMAAVRDCEIVFHLAALIGIPYSYSAPASYVQTNVGGTLNVLQCCRDAGVARVVHTSTSEVYGTARYVPIDEGHPLQAQSPYAASKIAADKLAESFHLSFGVDIVTVRPFNTFGPRQSSRAIIPTIISQALSEESVRLGNLTPTRDLSYVADTVDGIVAAGVSPAAVGRTINLGSGREISIGDLVQLVGRILELPVRLEHDERRVRPQGSEVERLLADTRLAADLLDWRPRVDLEEGLEKTVRWVRENLGRYRRSVYVV
jgi:dTDP-glucose 4,6-dehydratase